MVEPNVTAAATAAATQAPQAAVMAPEAAPTAPQPRAGEGAAAVQQKQRRRTRPARDQELRDLRDALEVACAEAAAARGETLKVRTEADDYRDKYLRERAELENHKRRIERAYADAARQERKAFLLRLLEVLDNLERALAYDGNTSAAAPEPDTRSLTTGLRMTYLQFKELLAREGLTEVPAVGVQFDPALHEAVAVDETSDRPEGEIVAALQAGYRHGDELLRPARVRVAAGHAGTRTRATPRRRTA